MSKYFSFKELECPCCYSAKVKNSLFDLLDKIREDFGEPIIVTSGYRCQEHNKKVGGVENSSHLLGLACDIRPLNMDTDAYDRLLKSCQKYSWNIGNGINKGFIHVDIREPKEIDYCGRKIKVKREWVY